MYYYSQIDVQITRLAKFCSPINKHSKIGAFLNHNHNFFRKINNNKSNIKKVSCTKSSHNLVFL